jgi:hypothetical protein
MTKFPCISVLLTMSLLISACSSPTNPPEAQAVQESSGSHARPPLKRSAAVSGSADGAPAGCGVPDVAQRVQDFATAFNGANLKLLSTFFSNQAPFAWYSAPEGAENSGKQNMAIYDPNELPAYFQRRQAEREQLDFIRIQINRWEPGRGLVHFEFTVNRQADDLNGGQVQEIIGKGAFHCKTRTFAVMSIGDA